MTNNAEARAREVAIKLIRGENVGAGDGDTYIPRSVSIDQMTAALMLIGNERAAQEREANAGLLNACQAMQQRITEVMDLERISPAMALEEMSAIVDAAIAKARGVA